MPGPQRYSHNHRDVVERPLVKLAERLGGVWLEGPPFDGWIWYPRLAKYMPVEVKDPSKEGWSSEYTPGQKRTIALLDRNHMPRWVWRTQEDVMRDFGVTR
jgi:hypothetical protein